MKRKIFLGLSLLFMVVVITGGVAAVLMSRLNRTYEAHYTLEVMGTKVNAMQVGILQAIHAVQEGNPGPEALDTLRARVSEVETLLVSVKEEVDSGQLARKGCGNCHEDSARLTETFGELMKSFSGEFERLTLLSSLFITRGEGVNEARVLQDLRVASARVQSLIGEISRIIDSMRSHGFTEMEKNIARINRTHEVTLIVMTLLVLVGIIVLFQAVTHPVRLLTRGTEAIVKGDYDHRIDLPGRDEMAVLAERFNYMAEVLSTRERRLQQKKHELEELTGTLEGKVRERTGALRKKQEELNRKYLELESANEELQASYIQLETTAAELEEAQTKLQENYDILKKMNSELQKANEVKNKFLSIMSHELRTPLTIINGYLSLILEKDYGHPGQELKEILKVVKEQGKNQLGLIEDLLDLTRIESGEFRLNRQAVIPGDLIRTVINTYRPRLEEKRIKVTLDVEESLPDVQWDHQKMLQVFQNLLDNALKFTPSGGWIALSARLRGDFIECRVSDNGIGIPRDKVDQVFDRFFQVDSSATRQFGGSGLGLSIVREIILAHGGKVFVESEEGKGTTFLILMPPGAPRRERMEEPTQPAPRPREGKVGQGETILVVDDDPSFLEMMRTILPREGFKVETVGAPAQVRERTVDCGASLILMDLMMPGMDGYELCGLLKSDPATRQIPIMVVSAAGGKDVIKKIFQAGADDYLLKPFNYEEILFRINNLLDHPQGGVAKGGLEDGDPETP